MAVSRLELFLVSEIVKAEKSGVALSSWSLAKTLAQNPEDKAEVNRLDLTIRYHLKKLAERGLLKPQKQRYEKKTYVYYTLNPERIVCQDGSVWIFSNPVTILHCPYEPECTHKKVHLEKCRLHQEAPQEIKSLIRKYLEI